MQNACRGAQRVELNSCSQNLSWVKLDILDDSDFMGFLLVFHGFPWFSNVSWVKFAKFPFLMGLTSSALEPRAKGVRIQSLQVEIGAELISPASVGNQCHVYSHHLEPDHVGTP